MNTEEKEKFLNLPNALTLMRVGLVPVFLFTIINKYAFGSLLVFFLAGLTDLLDGFTARSFGLRTRIGRLIDPLADKFLLSTAFIVLTIKGLGGPYFIPLWLTAVVISRDIIILAGSLVVTIVRGTSNFSPSLLGKISTACQISTVCWVLLANCIQTPSGEILSSLSWLTSPAVFPAIYSLTLITTFLSGVHYILKGIRMTFFSRPG